MSGRAIARPLVLNKGCALWKPLSAGGPCGDVADFSPVWMIKAEGKCVSRSSICSTDSFLWENTCSVVIFGAGRRLWLRLRLRRRKRRRGRGLSVIVVGSSRPNPLHLLRSCWRVYRGLTRCRMFRRLMTCRSMKPSRLPLMISARMSRSPSRCSLAPWCAWIAGFHWWRLPTIPSAPSMPWDLPSRAVGTRSCCLPWAIVWRCAALPGTIWA